MKKILVLFVLMLSACSAQLTTSPTETPEPSETPEPTATLVPTATASPTATRVPTDTPWPTKEDEVSAGECVIDNAFLLRLKTVVPFEEFALSHNIIGGIHSLAVWYVDPEINSQATEADLDAEQAAVIERATELAISLYEVDPCVGQTFTGFNPIVVDENFNGWFSGLLDSAEIDQANGEVSGLLDLYTGAYTIPSTPIEIGSMPQGSCSWQETEEKIWQHFSRDRQNVAFYFVYDLNGYNVWAQWDGPDMLVLNAASVMNVVMELDCLYPVPDRVILMTVDDNGVLVFLGIIFSNDGEILFDDLQVLIGQ